MVETPAALAGVLVGRERFGVLREEELLNRSLPLPFDARKLAALNSSRQYEPRKSTGEMTEERRHTAPYSSSLSTSLRPLKPSDNSDSSEDAFLSVSIPLFSLAPPPYRLGALRLR